MKLPEFLQGNSQDKQEGIKMNSMKNPYSKLDAIKDIKDELDQPLQPYIDPITPNKCSTLQAFGNTIKSFVGVGMLALPYAIKQSGLWAGILGLVLIGFVSAYTMKTLVRCKLEMELRRKFVEASQPTPTPASSASDDDEISYGYIGQHIFGRPGLYIVNFAIFTSQIGFCCAYILFIGHNLHSLWADIDMRYYALMFLPVYIFLSWIRSMRYLAPVAIAANVALALAVGAVFWFGFNQIKLEKSYEFIRLSTFPLFFGIAVFGYEGINLAIPIQSSMINPRAYPRMLNLSLVCVGILYILFGTLGYLFFGEDTDPVITKNLPGLEKYLLRHKVIKQNIIRTLIVGFTVLISIVVPYFDLLTSLIGSFSNSMVVFIFPTLFLLAIFRGRLSWPEVVLNVSILVFGIAASAVSSAIAIITMIQQVQDGSQSEE